MKASLFGLDGGGTLGTVFTFIEVMEADVRVIVSVLVFLALSDTAAAYAARSVGENAQGHSMPWYSYNARTQDDADALAMQNCRQLGLFNCRISMRFANLCFASYIDGRTGSELMATATTLADAQSRALFNCRNGYAPGYNNCRPGVVFCDTGVADPRLPGYTGPPAEQRRSDSNVAQKKPVPTPVAQGDFVAQALQTARDNSIAIALSLAFVLIGALILEKLKRPSNAAVVATQSLTTEPPISTPPPIPQITPSPHATSRMQASITHTQERSGYYVSLSLRFSDDTIKLIKARRLEDYLIINGITKPPITKTGLYAFFYGAVGLAYLGPFMILGGFIYGLAGGGDLAGFIVFAGILALLWVRFGTGKHMDTYDEQRYTIRHFFRHATIRLYADDAVGAKIIDQDIRDSLQQIRGLFDATAEAPKSETFEL